MRSHTFFQRIIPAFLLLIVPLSSAKAIPPLSSLLPFHRVEADPDKEYRLGDDNGPWMILAASFSGEDAAHDAHELVIEIRNRLKLEAYVYEQHYDFTEPVASRRMNRYGEPAQARHAMAIEFDEIAVMVGNYSSIDDPALEDDLHEIKHAQPECLNPEGGRGQTQRFAGLRKFYRLATSNEERNRVGPMGAAFVTRSPDLPDASAESGIVDSFILEMNRGVEFSLLDCPGRYTVRVAAFGGYTHIQKRDIHGNLEDDDYESQLADAAEKAHLLTEALRERGVDAYEYHDRNESVVCVGSFESVGTPNRNGTTEINPEIMRIMDTYGPVTLDGAFVNTQGTSVVGQRSLQPRALVGIPFDMQPMPVIVPSQSIHGESSGIIPGFFNR